jgi:hypothetical protein
MCLTSEHFRLVLIALNVWLEYRYFSIYFADVDRGEISLGWNGAGLMGTTSILTRGPSTICDTIQHRP